MKKGKEKREEYSTKRGERDSWGKKIGVREKNEKGGKLHEKRGKRP